MGGFLYAVTRGRKIRPYFILLYGPDGIGKSTFGADAPDPVFICSEDGTSSLDIARLPTPKNFSDILKMIEELKTGEHPYKTLVIDSIDWAEPLCWDDVCKEDGSTSIEKVDGGYGKGYIYALKKWQTMISALAQLREKMNVILISHSHVKSFNDPQQNSIYDRYELKLNAKAAALFREAVDAVLFGNYETYVKEDKNKKTKAYGDGSRVIYTERRPAFDAKNRYSLPFQLPLSWEAFESAVKAGDVDAIKEFKEHLSKLLLEVKDADIRLKAPATIEAAGQNLNQLRKIEERLNKVIAEEKK